MQPQVLGQIPHHGASGHFFWNRIADLFGKRPAEQRQQERKEYLPPPGTASLLRPIYHSSLRCCSLRCEEMVCKLRLKYLHRPHRKLNAPSLKTTQSVFRNQMCGAASLRTGYSSFGLDCVTAQVITRVDTESQFLQHIGQQRRSESI